MARNSSKLDSLERIHVHSKVDLREWLAQNHISSPGIWLVTFRKVTGKPRPEYAEVVEKLLCFGWIDSTVKKLDEAHTMILCTPRKPRSIWAKSNKERVERLTVGGLMQPRGLDVVALARSNGSWDSLNDVDAMIEPHDLRDALDSVPDARRHWDAYPASYRRGILYWLQSAKRAHTRSARIEQAVSHAALNTRLGGVTRAAASNRSAQTSER